jgi:ribosomal protein S26
MKISVWIASVPAKIKTEHLSNKSLEHYHYTTTKLDFCVSSALFYQMLKLSSIMQVVTNHFVIQSFELPIAVQSNKMHCPLLKTG